MGGMYDFYGCLAAFFLIDLCTYLWHLWNCFKYALHSVDLNAYEFVAAICQKKHGRLYFRLNSLGVYWGSKMFQGNEILSEK